MKSDNVSRPAHLGFDAGIRSISGMTQDLILGLVSLGIGASLLVIGLPNRHGESPRFLQFNSAPMLYPAIVLIFLGAGVIELLTWALTNK